MGSDADRYSADTPLSERVASMRSSAIRDLLHEAQRPGMLSLAGGLPAAELFDVEGIERAFAQVMREAPHQALQYGATDGQPSLRAAYGERRDALCDALVARFGDALRFERPDGGMFVWARFVDGSDASALLPVARDEGVVFVPGAAFYDDAPDESALRLSFATLAPAQLREAVERLSRAHRRLGAAAHREARAGLESQPVR